MKKIVILIALFVAWFFFWPVAIMVLLSKNKSKIVQDANRNISYRSAPLKNWNALVYLLLVDKFIRKLTYHRIGYSSYIISWLFSGDSTFHPICNDIGGGLYLAHPFATILNAQSIGNNFTCRQCTTIGNKSEDAISDKPKIGNNVTVGANVVIIGNITIGDNVLIGAGSVVVKDVPPNCVVVGNPAKVIHTNKL